MELKKILAVSGKSGLFKVISENKNGFIAESLLDHKRIPVYASDKISNLEEISIYTEDKEVSLKDVFKAIYDKESGGKALDPKTDENKVKDYFAAVLPNYDQHRVYLSDMKKVLVWYNILHDNQMLILTEEAEEKAPEDTQAEPPETKKDEGSTSDSENKQ